MARTAIYYTFLSDISQLEVETEFDPSTSLHYVMQDGDVVEFRFNL